MSMDLGDTSKINSPSTLTDEDINDSILPSTQIGYYVENGRVDLFFTRLDESKPKERLRHIVSIPYNRVYFGIDYSIFPDGYIPYLKCTPGTKVTTFALSGATQNSRIDKILASVTCALTKQYIKSIKDLLPIEENIDSSEIISEDNYLKVIQSFHRKVVGSLINHIKQSYGDESERLNLRTKINKSFARKAISALANVIKKDEDWKETEIIPGSDPLIQACTQVLNHMGIKMVTPPMRIYQKSKNKVEDIARSSGIRFRKVSLHGDWWKNAFGPIVGFLKDGSPVALLPHVKSGYRVFDTSKGTFLKISDLIKEDALDVSGYVFYKPLPNKKLNLKDIMLFCFSKHLIPDIGILLAMGLVSGIIGILPAIISGMLFETVIPEGQISLLFQSVLILFSFTASGLIFQMVRSYAMLRIESRLDYSMQAAVWDRLISLPAPFFREYTSGELQSRAMGIDSIRKTLSGMAVSTILSSVFSLFNFAVLFAYSSRLASFAIFISLGNISITIVSSFIQKRYERQQIKVSNALSGSILQIIQGINKIKTAGAENRAFFKWSKDFSHQCKLSFKSSIVGNNLGIFSEVFGVISSIIIFCIAISEKNLNVGGFIAFTTAFGAFQGALTSMASVALTVNNIGPIYENTKPILDTKPECDEMKEDPGDLDGSIEIKHISFKYKDDSPDVLSDVSLKVDKGEYLGVVGASGSGKSTLMRILLGFEKPHTGSIYYGGYDLDNIDVRAVRRQMGVVLQNSKLLNGDIHTNIIGAGLGLTMDDAWDAAKLAGIDEDIREMPMGMFTVLGEGSAVISGGQRQRIMIARALVKKPSLLLFDEATSALDNNSQALVIKSLENLNATRIVIAHRLSTVMNCNRIVVMDKGKIVEEGSYQELMDKQGFFYALVEKQVV